MPETSKDPAQSNTPSNAGTGPASGTPAPDDKLTAALDANRKLQERYDNLQQVLGRQSRELGELRRQSTGTREYDDYGDSYDSRSDRTPDDLVKQQLRAILEQQDLIRYRQEVADWATYQPDVEKIVNDQTKLSEVIAWKPDGFGGVMPDWNRTFKNAKTQVELEKYRAAQAAANQSQKGSNEQRTTLQQMATLSGTTSVPQDRELTLDDLRGKTAEEIAKMAQAAGLVPPGDPLR